MNALDLKSVNDYVATNIVEFHQRRLAKLESLELLSLLKQKNPYLFRAKNMMLASQLVEDLLNARLSSSEEEMFGQFLEGLAIFVAIQTCNAHKSSAIGVDFEFVDDSVHYVVSIKSGTNWGNSSQQKKQQQDFEKAVATLKQSRHTLNVQPVLGICYGKTKTSFLRGYMKVVGQSFWHLISDDEHLYQNIVEPLGTMAAEYNAQFGIQRARIAQQFTDQMTASYCHTDGTIDWAKLIQLNSGNMVASETNTNGNTSQE